MRLAVVQWKIIRKLQLEEPVKKHNLPEHQSGFGWFFTLTGELKARIYPSAEYSAISPTAPSSAAQQFLETELLTAYKNRGGQILFEHQVNDFAQNKEMVQIKAHNKPKNLTQQFQAKYLIAADGAHSLVREKLKIPMVGPNEINVNTSVYCEIDINDKISKENQCGISYILQKDGRPTPMIISIDGQNKWIFLFPSAGASASMLQKIYTDEYVKNRIHEVIGDFSLL